MRHVVALLLFSLAVTGCSKSTDTLPLNSNAPDSVSSLDKADPRPEDTVAPTGNEEVASTDRLVLESVDGKVLARFPAELNAVANYGVPAADDALIGRNKEWGEMYSPRFQVGAGRALRISLKGGMTGKGRLAFLAIQAGTEVIREDGYVPSRLPESMDGSDRLGLQDILSGAAFFMADACVAVLALNDSEGTKGIASTNEVVAMTQALSRALNWLLAERHVLIAADAEAPNRLLLNALAYQSCGALTGNLDAMFVASELVDMALALFHSDGYFLERGGWDTSYQGVSILAGNELMLTGYPDLSGELERVQRSAADWLAGRIDSEGRLDWSGNTRTCGGGETFLGESKQVSVKDVFLALAYQGVRTRHDGLPTVASRFSDWVSSNAGAVEIAACTQ